MKHPVPAILVSACLLSLATTSRAMEVADNFFTRFSACDSSMFPDIKKNEPTWRSAAPLGTSETSAWIKVPDRKDDKKNEVVLQNPVSVAGVELVSYFDEISALSPDDSYYFWGFTVKGNVAGIEKKIRAAVYDNARLRRDGPVFVRTELKLGNGPWQKFNTANAAVASGKVERVFLIEAHETRPGTVRLSCSLQGTVTAGLIEEGRPDVAFDNKAK